MTQHSELDYGDIQGLVRFGHGQLRTPATCCSTSQTRAAARAWLRHGAGHHGSDHEPPPETALQIAFTSAGLRAAGRPRRRHRRFSDEFIAGMGPSPAARAASATSAPTLPRAGTGAAREDAVPDLVVMLFALRGQLAAWEPGSAPGWQRRRSRSRHGLPPTTWAISSRSALRTASASRARLERRARRRHARAAEYANVLALGEVLLGYPNEYGHTPTGRCSTPTSIRRPPMLPPAEDQPRPARPRPQRQLSRVPPAAPGRAPASGSLSTTLPAATRRRAGCSPTRWSAGTGRVDPWCRPRPSRSQASA